MATWKESGLSPTLQGLAQDIHHLDVNLSEDLGFGGTIDVELGSLLWIQISRERWGVESDNNKCFTSIVPIDTVTVPLLKFRDNSVPAISPHVAAEVTNKGVSVRVELPEQMEQGAVPTRSVYRFW